ncbi:polysaccharide pyruvyl transferase family protein [Zoogloea sp. LCSB751]|uniref:polysaccharide pyruvyl transferase family protein n=1 Tax=Zoogloea sp. LCSB751 TaxID=1965277 RepID=UPI0009A55898|nr:polysaccharide pyruvyl transferase family protein [Zoogloea sp. LCSB751]
MNKVKIGLITIHYANSYGGLLQAYASQKVLSKYGDVKILDYAHPSLRNTLRTVRWGARPKDVLRIGKDLLRYFPRSRVTRKFKSFIRDEFFLSDRCASADDLRRVTRDFKVLVCGSDQIWNPNIIGELDRNYFLNFSTDCKKISLSSSSGSYRFTNDDQRFVKEDLLGFSGIAIREPDTAKAVSDILNRDDIVCTPDPTLLLTGRDWRQLSSRSAERSSGYILVYSLIKDELLRESVRYIANKLGKKVFVIDQDLFLGFNSDRHIMDASPYDFLYFFSNAEYVVTNSFHGTAFSLLFGRPFSTVVPHSGRNRVENLLRRVGEEGRLVESSEDIKRFDANLNATSVELRLKELQSEGVGYLDKCLLEVS